MRRHHIARETECGQLVIDRTVARLHGKHPVQVPLDFGKEVRELPVCWDIPFEPFEIFREMFVQREKRVGGDSRVHNVLAVIAGIVPALRAFDGTIRPRGIVERHILVQVSCSTFPLPCVLFFEGQRRTLVVEPLGSSLEYILVGFLFHDEVLAEYVPAHLHAIFTGFLELGKIDKLHVLATSIPYRCGLRSCREHRFPGSVLDNNVTGTFD